MSRDCRRTLRHMAGMACMLLLGGCAGLQQNPHYDPAKPHHTPSGFRNLDPDARMGGGFARVVAGIGMRTAAAQQQHAQAGEADGRRVHNQRLTCDR